MTVLMPDGRTLRRTFWVPGEALPRVLVAYCYDCGRPLEPGQGRKEQRFTRKRYICRDTATCTGDMIAVRRG